ncbi:tctex1d1-b [Symbiodinium sp. KB8]|nr:tctex1d1-b [Symbiodinium sp. KB8]
MESYLQDKEYAVEDAKAWTLDLSNEIKASVKQDLNIPRYKIIVQVNSDNWASYTFENQFAAMGEQHQVHVWENTYIMAPKDDEKMLPSKVTAVIKNVMESYLQDKEYAVEDAKAWTLDLSNEIKASVKQDLNIPRYKIIVQVVIGEQASQGIRVASKCLWDVNSDNWASYTFENQSLFAVGMVFGCYYE